MKTNSQKSNAKTWVAAAIGSGLLLLSSCPRTAVAQSNTFPSTGNVGIGTTTPAAKLEVSGANVLPRVTNTNATSYGGLELFEGGTIKFGLHTLGSSSGSSFVGGANAVQLWNYANGPMVFSTNSSERMRIDAGGNVGIGTTGPKTKLHVDSSGIASFTGSTAGAVSVGGNGINYFFPIDFRNTDSATYPYPLARIAMQFTNSGSNLLFGTSNNYGSGVTNTAMAVDYSGNVGIGTASPDTNARLHIYNAPSAGMDIQSANAAGWSRLRLVTGTHTYGWFAGDSTQPEAPNKIGLYDYTASAFRMMIDSSGNVGIGNSNPAQKLDVTGNINASGAITGGTINAKYQDVAEWVQSSQELAAGTVIVVDQTKSNQVIASSHAYDTRVAGVISAQPGIALGENGAGKVLVATTGRVRIKVDASRGSIQVGDLLVTSDVPGVAMKSQLINVGGVQIHRPGTLIGKALEPLAGGTGEILVLLSLQ